MFILENQEIGVKTVERGQAAGTSVEVPCVYKLGASNLPLLAQVRSTPPPFASNAEEELLIYAS
jgi:hypothetical protein